MARAKILVSVDGSKLRNVMDTAEKYNVKANSLYMALHNNQKHFFNYRINKIDKYTYDLITSDTSLKEKNLSKRAVCVKCLDTGVVYPSISAAAKACNEHMWTMSVKMEETGKFIDKEGKQYIRLAPMNKLTDRVYGIKASTVTRDIKPYKKTVQAIETVESQPVSAKDNIIQSLIKSTNLLMDNKNYSQAAQILTILSDFDKQ